MAEQKVPMYEQMEYLKKYRKAMLDLLQAIFPVTCENCDRRYTSYKDMIENTMAVEPGTEAARQAPAEKNIVSITRVCSCGRTIVSSIENRRDLSAKGMERREKFGELLKILKSMGMENEDARGELLRVLHGEKSDQLEKMGLLVTFD